MIISIDYDHTYTADPELWRQFIRSCQFHGHTVICTTGRKERPSGREVTLPPEIPVICAHNEWKALAAARLGFDVDVWIDDEPGHIEPPRKLDWSVT